jgi:ABC-type transporter Mla MlaB component
VGASSQVAPIDGRNRPPAAMSFGSRRGLVTDPRKEPGVAAPDEPPMTPRRPRLRAPGSGTSPIRLVVDGPIARDDIPGLCARVGGLLEESDAVLVICDVGALRRPDAVTVDALAQLQLKVRRHGRSIEMHNAVTELRALFALMGLDGVVRFVPELQGRGEPEHREEGLHIQEEVEGDDLPV